MKNAVVIVFGALMLVACSGKKEKTNSAGGEAPEGGMKIAFYVSDSVAKNYEYFTMRQKELMDKQASLEKKLMAIQESGGQLQNRLISGQSQGLLSEIQINALQRQIQGKSNEMMQLQQTEGAELEKMNYELTLEIVSSLEKYAKEYAEKNGYTAIVNYVQGGQIMYIDPSLDITEDFTDYLNERTNSVKGFTPEDEKDEEKEEEKE